MPLVHIVSIFVTNVNNGWESRWEIKKQKDKDGKMRMLRNVNTTDQRKIGRMRGKRKRQARMKPATRASKSNGGGRV